MASTITDRQALANQVEEVVSHVAAGYDAPERPVVLRAVDNATYWFSRFKPLDVVDTSLDGDGSARRFALSSLGTSWINGISRITAIEHPMNSDPTAPEFLEDDGSAWSLYPNDSAPTHILFATAPASGTNNIGVHYKAVHAVTDSTISLDEPDRPALVYLSACLLARGYQTRYAQTTDANLEADSIDYRQKSDEWGAIAKDLCAQASAMSGVDFDGPGDGGGASGVSPPGRRVDIDPSTRYPNPVWRDRGQR